VTSASLEVALARLAERVPKGMVLGLDAVRRALAALGSPHEGLACVHVAGTNGKGSVSAMVERALREAGLTTGLYTSPHLARYAERVRIDGAPLDDDALADALTRALDAGPELTFFEALTVAAFHAFRAARVDVAVLEVGLGGRLDATNVCAPSATAITSIGLDHERVLGPTLRAIALEKAGIAKPGVPLVVGPVPPEARAAIEEVALRVGAPLSWVREAGQDARPEGLSFTRLSPRDASGRRGVELTTPGAPTLEVEPGLLGPHQAANAAIAVALVRAFAASSGRPELGPAALDASLARGLARASWPGRLERRALPRRGRSGRASGPRAQVEWLFDCAHNEEGARALAAALPELGLTPERTVLVFGALADKAFEPMLRTLAPLAERRVYASPQGRAPASQLALAALASGLVTEGADEVLDAAERLARPGDVVLVTGSIYLVAELRARLLGEPRDPIVAL
jgi:dihydrofolate synthase/folylpolyglutamate synthase